MTNQIKKNSKKSEGQEIWLHTNGSGKTEKWWRELYSMLDPERDRVVYGVDGLNDTAHMYRKFAKFDDSITAMKIGAEYGMRLNEWQFIVFKFNQHQVQQARQMAKEEWFQPVKKKKGRGTGIGTLIPTCPT